VTVESKVASAVLGPLSSSPIPLHKSVVQMQALIVSLSTDCGEQVACGSTGLSMLPRRTEVGKHSRITAVSLSDFFQE